MVLDLHIENNAICSLLFKTISKLRDHISLRRQLTSVLKLLRKAKLNGLYEMFVYQTVVL